MGDLEGFRSLAKGVAVFAGQNLSEAPLKAGLKPAFREKGVLAHDHRLMVINYLLRRREGAQKLLCHIWEPS